MTTNRIGIGDIHLNVLDEGRGPVLLLVHGFPLDHTMWQHQIAVLRGEFRILAPDLRGFGQSDVTSGTVTMQQMADDLAALLAELEITDKVHFCGLSMGGYVAWQFWQRHARLLASLILCDTRAVADAPEAAQTRLKAADLAEREGSAPVVATMMPRLFAESTHKNHPERVESLRQTMLRTAPAGVAAAQRGMAQRPDVTGLLAQIRVPALVICGEHDVISPAAEMRTLAEKIPGARYMEIAGTGHMAPLEDPAPVNKAIREFLRRQTGA